MPDPWWVKNSHGFLLNRALVERKNPSLKGHFLPENEKWSLAAHFVFLLQLGLWRNFDFLGKRIRHSSYGVLSRVLYWPLKMSFLHYLDLGLSFSKISDKHL